MASQLPINADRMSRSQCPENQRLLVAFGGAAEELLLLQEQNFPAILSGKLDPEDYQKWIQLARERRQAAKQAYLSHVEEHGCERLAQEMLAAEVTFPNREPSLFADRRQRVDPKNTHRRRRDDS